MTVITPLLIGVIGYPMIYSGEVIWKKLAIMPLKIEKIDHFLILILNFMQKCEKIISFFILGVPRTPCKKINI